MNSALDQRWGRPFEQYVIDYGIVAHRGRNLVYRETEEEAQAVKEAMYLQVVNAHAFVPGMAGLMGGDDVTPPMLETVLKLSHSPHHLHFFADPVFIGGCIRLLDQIRPEGKPSPLSCELGYLCFRIIAIGIGTWILKVTNNLDAAIEDIETNLRTEPLLVFSDRVSQAIQQAMLEMASGISCDWIMGWATTRGHPNPQRFLLPSDLRSLLSILWEDRKLYLRALLRTYFPGVSGVMFVLWRYLDVNHAARSARPSKRMVIPFCELLWRSMLVATEDQLKPMAYMNNLVHHNKKAELWDDSPKFVDFDDSRTLLRALTARVAPADLRLFKPLTLANLGVLLQFVTSSIQPGSEDLFPSLFGGAIECVWSAIQTGDFKSSDVVEVAGSVFSSLSDVIVPLNDSNRRIRTALEALVMKLEQHDFLELLARLILLLIPNKARSIFKRDIPQNTMFINNTSFLVGTLAKISPDSLLGDRFKGRMDAWWKMNYQLSMFEHFGPANAPVTHRALHAECTELWADLGGFLGLSYWSEQLTPYMCSYSRCPYGKGVLPVEFLCTRCHEFRYCSAQCQTRDWTMDHGTGSHRQLCTPSSQLPLQLSVVTSKASSRH